MTAGARSADVDRLIAQQALQHVAVSARGARSSLVRSRRLLVSAETLLDDDPDTAYVLAYDAARQAGAAVLAAQGLRATPRGGHVAVERALVAQFAPSFADFRLLRRRRNELEYPSPSGPETVDITEAREAVRSAETILAQAEGLVPVLRRYGL